MRNNTSNNLQGQIVVGALVIGLGILFLLDNLDIIDFHHALHFWPSMFIIFGLMKIYDTRSPNGFVVGCLLVLAGVLMTLNRLGFAYVSWHTMWPLVLIMLGISVVVKAVTGRRQMAPPVSGDKPGERQDDSTIDVTAILGGFQRRIWSNDFRGGEITAVMGGCELDLRESSIASEAVINVFAVCGGITIKVPPDWTVILQGTPILGGFDEKTITPPDNSKRLIIRGYAIMGGLEVRN